MITGGTQDPVGSGGEGVRKRGGGARGRGEKGGDESEELEGVPEKSVSGEGGSNNRREAVWERVTGMMRHQRGAQELLNWSRRGFQIMWLLTRAGSEGAQSISKTVGGHRSEREK